MATQESDPSERLVELVFRVTDTSYPFVGATADGDCELTLEKMLPRGDGAYAEFFRIEGLSPERVVELAEANDRVESVRVIECGPRTGLYEFVVAAADGVCPARDLATLGANPTAITSADGEGEIVAEFLADDPVEEIVSSFLGEHDGVEFVRKRSADADGPLVSEAELESVAAERLTPRQHEVLAAAVDAGYYEFPRRTSGKELAAELGVSQPTFSEHIRAAERKLLEGTVDAEADAES